MSTVDKLKLQAETTAPQKPRVVAIIQARMGSTRLPGKVMMDIAGKPMLKRVIRRVQRGKTVDEVVLAIPDTPDNNVLRPIADTCGVSVVHGPEADVLARYRMAANTSGAGAIVRITADCPLIDPDVIDEVVRYFLRYVPDYASNTIERTWPKGLDVEVFNAAALQRADAEATTNYDREHVTPYMLASHEVRRLPVTGGGTDGTVNWSVDTQEDLDRVRRIYACFPRDDFTWQEAWAISQGDTLQPQPEPKEMTETTAPTESGKRKAESGNQRLTPQRKIAIIGTAPSTRDLAPYDDPTWEIWSLSNRVVTDQIKRWDRHFELHPLSQFERDPEARPYIDWMHRQDDGKPIYLQSSEQYPGIKVAVQFPYEPLVEKFGRYFTSTIAWQIALAIHEGAEVIGLWGIDLMLQEEYHHQRPCVEYLLGWARGLGIGVVIPRQSSLMKPQMLYGMEGECGARQAIVEHKNRLGGMVQNFQAERDQAALKMAHAQGAIEGLTFAEQMSG